MKTAKERRIPPPDRLPFATATSAYKAALGRHHGGVDGSRQLRLPIMLAAHLGDPDEVMLTPSPDGTITIQGLPLRSQPSPQQ